MVLSHARPRSSPLRCAFCHGDLDCPVRCRRCGTALHAACQKELTRCPTLGCGLIEVAPPRFPGVRAAFEVASDFAVICTFMIMALVAIPVFLIGMIALLLAIRM